MRNLKKVLALVVAVAMIASMGLVASAASYSDVASNASYADAVNLLSNLGIITGYEDGTFKPDNTVTRAEAATMIVRMLGQADEAEMGETSFTDVAADNWASGYVNVAYANGIINGMGDGTFNPNGEVTYGQIVKMIVCALGYAPVAEANGGYLGGGYLLAGSSQHAGFTKGVAGTQNAAASRATVAKLIYNALEVELMDQTSYSTGIMGDQYEVLENETILSNYLELEKVEGVITNTYLAQNAYSADEAKTVDLVITKNYSETKDYDGDFAAEETVTLEVVAEEAATLLGYSVVAYVGENDGEPALFAVAPKAGKNNVVVLDTELIAEDGLTETSIEYYKSENAKSTTEAEIQAFVGKEKQELTVDYNGIQNGFLVTMKAVVDAVAAGAEEITLIDNDNDGDFEFASVTVPTDDAVEFVVEEVENEDESWWFTSEEDDELFIDYEDEDVLYTVIKDGKVVDASAIVAGDVVTALDWSETLTIKTVYVSSVVVEGTVDEVEDEVYTINGKEYKLSPIAMADEELEAGEEGLFYVNATGKIAFVDTVKSIAGSDYVYVIGTDFDDSAVFSDGEYLVQVVTAAGAVEILTIKSKKVTVIGEDGKAVTGEKGEDLSAKEAYDAIVEYGVGIARIKTTAAGEVSEVYLPGSEEDFTVMVDDAYAELDENVEYNEARGTYGKLDLTADVLVFHIDTTEKTAAGEIDYEEAVTVSTVGKLFADESSYKFTAYGEEDEVPGVLVVEDAKTALDSEAPVMVVTKVSKVVADDEDTFKLTGIRAGEKVSVIVDPEESSVIYDKEAKEYKVAKGDVVIYAESGEYATDVAVLYNEEGVAGTDDIATVVDDDDMVSVHFGTIEDKTAKTVTIGTDKFWFADDVNVTVVDTTGYDVAITAGSLSSVKTSKTYTMEAFVKTALDVEDVITDVVVFKSAIAE